MMPHRLHEAIHRVAEYLDPPIIIAGGGDCSHFSWGYIVWHKGTWCEVSANYDGEKDQLVVTFKGPTPRIVGQFKDTDAG